MPLHVNDTQRLGVGDESALTEEVLPVCNTVAVADKHAGGHDPGRGRLLVQAQAGLVGEAVGLFFSITLKVALTFRH